MDLHKSRSLLFGGVIFLAGGAFILLRGLWPFSSVQVILGTVAMLMGAVLIGVWRKPLRVRHIGPNGLNVHLAGVKRLVSWDEITALVIDQQIPTLPSRGGHRPHLLLVPSNSGFNVPLDRHSPVDNEPCLVLLELEDVRETPEQIGEILKRYGGPKFTDMRARRAEKFDAPKFNVVLRGYDIPAVDDLVRKGQTALAIGSSVERHAMKAQIEGAKIPVALRGYDRVQVESTFAVLSAELAAWPEQSR